MGHSQRHPMALPEVLRGRLRLPVVGAPMFILSTPALVTAQGDFRGQAFTLRATTGPLMAFGGAAPWPIAAELPDAALDAALRAACAELPDSARPGHWVRATAPFDAAHGMATVNGRPCRDAIEHHHRSALAAGYMEQDKNAIS